MSKKQQLRLALERIIKHCVRRSLPIRNIPKSPAECAKPMATNEPIRRLQHQVNGNFRPQSADGNCRAIKCAVDASVKTPPKSVLTLFRRQQISN
jgi:hypothetical protein